MKASTKLFFSALLISFLGTLPLGTLNVSITNLAINRGYTAATLFAMGAILVEVAIVRIAVVAVGKLEKLQRYFKLFSWLKFKIHTGRTHQIRVHAKYIGHSIVCDDSGLTCT